MDDPSAAAPSCVLPLRPSWSIKQGHKQLSTSEVLLFHSPSFPWGKALLGPLSLPCAPQQECHAGSGGDNDKADDVPGAWVFPGVASPITVPARTRHSISGRVNPRSATSFSLLSGWLRIGPPLTKCPLLQHLRSYPGMCCRHFHSALFPPPPCACLQLCSSRCKTMTGDSCPHPCPPLHSAMLRTGRTLQSWGCVSKGSAWGPLPAPSIHGRTWGDGARTPLMQNYTSQYAPGPRTTPPSMPS